MLPKSQRLRNTTEFRRVYTRGRSYVHPLLVLYVLPNPDVQWRFGFSISRKLGGAVQRNRIKRRLREACRARTNRLIPGFDFVIVGRGRLRESARHEEICKAVDDLFRRAALLRESSQPAV